MHYSIGVDQSLTCTGIVAGLPSFGLSEDFEMLKYVTITTNKDTDTTTLTKAATMHWGEDQVKTIARCSIVANQVIDFCKEFCAEHLKDGDTLSFSIEGLAWGARGNAVRDLASLQGLIIEAALRGLPVDNVSIISPTTVKKRATGDGKAKKDALFESLPPDAHDKFLEYKKTKGRYDLTDAYWIAAVGGEGKK